MKRIGIWIVCMIMLCAGAALAEEARGEEYRLQDFIDSKLFTDPLGHSPYDRANGPYPAATYERITEAFPSAVDRCYARAPEIRRILFRIPPKIGESSNEWSDSKLLYSYWKASDGIFVVLWTGNASMGGVGLEAGRAFCFSSLDELAPVQADAWRPEAHRIPNYHQNLIMKAPVYIGNGNIEVILGHLIPEQVYCLTYAETKGFDLKSYLLWGRKYARITDCSPLIEDEIRAMMAYINEIEWGLHTPAAE